MQPDAAQGVARIASRCCPHGILQRRPQPIHPAGAGPSSILPELCPTTMGAYCPAAGLQLTMSQLLPPPPPQPALAAAPIAPAVAQPPAEIPAAPVAALTVLAAVSGAPAAVPTLGAAAPVAPAEVPVLPAANSAAHGADTAAHVAVPRFFITRS
jgi:hypothetical protein